MAVTTVFTVSTASRSVGHMAADSVKKLRLDSLPLIQKTLLMTSNLSITQTQEPNHSRFPVNPNWEVMISLEYLTLAPYHNTLPWFYPVLCTFLYYHHFTVTANFSGNKTHRESDMKFSVFSLCGAMTSLFCVWRDKQLITVSWCLFQP